ncbi:MAG: hypothetical protein FWG73_06645 [Planctomycetaceae bacterium]|nr:hypothetical protein [Planctomycetaceae bacterium]
MQKIKTFTILLLSLMLVGCGDRGPNTHYVEGIITLHGEPLEGALITFHPVPDGTNDKIAAGRSDESGVYKLTADSGLPERGAFEGDYIVTISRIDVETTLLPPDPRDPSGNQMSGPSIHTQITPRVYGSPSTSPFTATVNPGRNENVNFDMTSR